MANDLRQYVKRLEKLNKERAARGEERLTYGKAVQLGVLDHKEKAKPER